MLKKIILIALLLSLARFAIADETYNHSVEVDFAYLEGTEDSNFFCWTGDTDYRKADPEDWVEVPKDQTIIVEFDGDSETLNCLQDVTLPGGEQVVVHRINFLY